MTVKVSSLLAVVAIWAMMIPAVLAEPEAWWSLIFAGLATGSIGLGFWRRLGLGRMLAIAGIWGGTALIIANGEAVWPSVMAFLATATLAHAPSGRTPALLGIALAGVWLLSSFIIIEQHDGAVITVFAALTVGVLAGTRAGWAKGLIVMFWWGLAGAIILQTDNHYWLTGLAWILSITSIGFPHWSIPKGIEWDFGERDDRTMDRL